MESGCRFRAQVAHRKPSRKVPAGALEGDVLGKLVTEADINTDRGFSPNKMHHSEERGDACRSSQWVTGEETPSVFSDETWERNSRHMLGCRDAVYR